MELLKTVTGYLGGTLEIYEKKVVIKKTGIAGLASGMGKNGKEIYMKSITGIQIKNPTIFTNGKFSINSTGENSNKVRDENTVIFLKKHSKEFETAKQLIEQLANQ